MQLILRYPEAWKHLSYLLTFQYNSFFDHRTISSIEIACTERLSLNLFDLLMIIIIIVIRRLLQTHVYNAQKYIDLPDLPYLNNLLIFMTCSPLESTVNNSRHGLFLWDNPDITASMENRWQNNCEYVYRSAKEPCLLIIYHVMSIIL